MKLLKCKLCFGELDILKDNGDMYKKIKCRNCGFSNKNKQSTEVIILNKKVS